jgi:ribosome-associated toxin RatA of RatAB toxin-antitoxin module
MHAERSIDIAAPPHAVYELAQDIGRWPQLLPHYRYVRVLSEREHERTAEMAARRGWIPVRWTALERLDPVTPRIEFRHLSGWTVGMEVAWIFEPIALGTRVTIVHDLHFSRIPVLGGWVSEHIIGDFFIQSIAGRTLARMKELAEKKT